MKLFSGTSNKPLAEKVAQRMGIGLSPIEDFVFPDGEKRIQIQVPVLGEDTAVIQSTNPPVDSYYLETFLIVDGLKRNGAKSVSVVMPYMGYMRQDHIFRDGEAVSLLVMIKILEALGVSRFIGFDFHTVKLPEFFHIPVSHLSALPLFAEEIRQQGWTGQDSVLVSPDMGGIRRIKEIAELLSGMPWLAMEKNRDKNNGKVEITGISGTDETASGAKENNLEGKRVIIVDDMISSGSTIVEAANLLKKYGAREVNVFTTHPIFSKNAPKMLEDSLVDRVYVTDDVQLSEEKLFPKLRILSVADQIAMELQKR